MLGLAAVAGLLEASPRSTGRANLEVAQPARPVPDIGQIDLLYPGPLVVRLAESLAITLRDPRW